MSIIDLLAKRDLKSLIIKPYQTSVSAPTNNPPVWGSQPSPIFFEGASSQYDVGALASDPDSDPITISIVVPSSSALTDGVVWNASSETLEYDGSTASVLNSVDVYFIADDGTDTTNSDTITLSVSDVLENHPMSQNVNGGFISNGSTRVWDTSERLYLMTRVTQFNAIQPLSMFYSGRGVRSAEHEALHTDNPYVLMVLHDSPLRITKAYQVSNADSLQWRYEYAVNNRKSALLFRDQDDDDEVPFIEAGSSQTANSQTAHHFKMSDPDLQTHWAGIVADVLTGRNQMSRNMIGVDISDYVGYFNDGTPSVNPKFNRTTTVTLSQGNVVNVSSNNSLGKTHNIVEIDTRFSAVTDGPGTLSEDNSFEAISTPYYIGFHPANNNSPGWAAFVAIGYKEVGGSNAQIYVRNLPGSAPTTQLYKVKNGDAYNINDSKSGTDSPDQDGDGSGDNNRDAGNKTWYAGYQAMYDQADTLIEAYTGHKTGRGHNAGGDEGLKKNGGLPHPHGGFRAMDYMNAENGDGAGDFQPNNNSGTQEYTVRSGGMEELMRGLYLMESYIRPNPGGWNQGKARGVLYDISVYNNNTYSYAYVNDPANPGLMASYLRFYKALISTVPNTNMGYTVQIGYPCLCEEAFLDFDLGWVQPEPLGTYDPSGGGNGSAGFPVGAWTWATGGTGDFVSGGKRIYGRRLGDRHYMFINMADPSSNRTYNPTHLGGSIDGSDDQITPADFASIYASGHLVGGETLKTIDMANYVNQTMTAAMQSHALSAADWVGFNYGPRQAHPNDMDNDPDGGSYRLSDADWIARDNTMHDNTAVNQSQTWDLGKQEAVIFEIV